MSITLPCLGGALPLPVPNHCFQHLVKDLATVQIAGLESVFRFDMDERINRKEGLESDYLLSDRPSWMNAFAEHRPLEEAEANITRLYLILDDHINDPHHSDLKRDLRLFFDSSAIFRHLETGVHGIYRGAILERPQFFLRQMRSLMLQLDELDVGGKFFWKRTFLNTLEREYFSTMFRRYLKRSALFMDRPRTLLDVLPRHNGLAVSMSYNTFDHVVAVCPEDPLSYMSRLPSFATQFRAVEEKFGNILLFPSTYPMRGDIVLLNNSLLRVREPDEELFPEGQMDYSLLDWARNAVNSNGLIVAFMADPREADVPASAEHYLRTLGQLDGVPSPQIYDDYLKGKGMKTIQFPMTIRLESETLEGYQGIKDAMFYFAPKYLRERENRFRDYQERFMREHWIPGFEAGYSHFDLHYTMLVSYRDDG